MGRNNKSIHLLRGNKNNHPSEVLDSGQPFYDKYGRSIYVGDGNTSLSELAPISGSWDKLAYEESQSDVTLYISGSTLIKKIKSAGFLRCTSSNGEPVGLGGLFVDGSSNPDYAYVEDKWNLIYVVDPSNHNLGGILAIGDTKGVFYGKITSTTSIEWVRLTAPNSLSYTYLNGSNNQTVTSLTLGKDFLVPSSPSSVDLGSESDLFNTVYAKYFSVPGTCLNFRYDNNEAEENLIATVRYGYEYRRPDGNTVPIQSHRFMDGSGEDGEGHLTWIKAKGLVPYQNNEVNFDLENDSNNLVFGASNSTRTISRYEFKNGRSGEESDFSWIKSKGFIPYGDNLINFNLNSDASFIAFGYNGSRKPINNYVFYNGQTESGPDAVKATVDCKGLKTHTWGTGSTGAEGDNPDLKNTSSSSIPYSIGASAVKLGSYTVEAYSKGTVVGSSDADYGDCALYSISTGVARFFFRNNGAWGEVPVKQAIQATYASGDTTKGTIDSRLDTLNTRLDSLGFKQGVATNIIGSISSITLKKLGKYVICSFTASGSFSFTLPADFKPSNDIQSSVGGATYVPSAREYRGGGGNITVSSTDGNVTCTVQGPMPSGRPVSLGWSTSLDF